MKDVIPHRNWVAGQRRLRDSLTKHRPGRLVVIIGVSGVGKTTLRWSVLRELFGDPLLWRCGNLPVMEVMGLLSKNAYFSSKGLAEDSYNQLFVPDLTWLLRDAPPSPQNAAIEESVLKSQEFWVGKRPILTETSSWNGFKDTARTRGLKIYSLEHASALCINHKDTTPAQHIINLMSVMENCGAMGLLTAVQNGAELWKERSEIRRRMDVIWLAPYDVSVPDDLKHYLALLKKIGTRYTFDPPNLLGALAPEIAAATASVFDEMVTLLERSFNNARDQGRSTIRKADIQDAYYNAKDLKTLWSDVETFWDTCRADKASAVSERADEIWPKVEE